MANINDAFPSNYLKASDLKGHETVATIDRVAFEPVGRQKEMKAVLYFKGKEKGLILNKTNATKISQLIGSQETEDWDGFAVKLYPSETEFGGETVECIRIKPAPSNGGTRRQSTPPPAPEPSGEPLDDSDIPF